MTTSGLAALVALASMALAGGVVLLVMALRGLPPRLALSRSVVRAPEGSQLR